MKKDILEVVKYMSYPYVAEMVGIYAKEKAPEVYDEMKKRGYFNRTHHGSNIPHAIGKFFKTAPPISDVYTYWNALVNENRVPTFNENYEEYIVKRYGGGKMGENIEKFYENFKNTPNDDRRNPVETPEVIQELRRDFTIEDVSVVDNIEDIPDYPEKPELDSPVLDVPSDDRPEELPEDLLNELALEQFKDR